MNTRARTQQLLEGRRKARPGEAATFLDSIPPTDECVLWPFSLNSSGHAAFQGTTVGRILLGLQTGDEMQALHTCHVSDCVNPRHLVRGTAKDNTQMMLNAGRARPGGVPVSPKGPR